MNLLLISVDSLRLDFAPGISATVLAPRFSDFDARFSHLPTLLFGFFGHSPGPHLALYRAIPV